MRDQCAVCERMLPFSIPSKAKIKRGVIASACRRDNTDPPGDPAGAAPAVAEQAADLHGLRPFPTHTEIRGKDRPAAGSLFSVAVRAFPCPLKAAASARPAVKVVLLLPMRLIRPEQQEVIKVARLLPGFCGFPRTDRTMNRPPCPEP